VRNTFTVHYEPTRQDRVDKYVKSAYGSDTDLSTVGAAHVVLVGQVCTPTVAVDCTLLSYAFLCLQTEHEYGEAWGNYKFIGQIRPSDGMVILLRESVSCFPVLWSIDD
jgi:hypothetical protein